MYLASIKRGYILNAQVNNMFRSEDDEPWEPEHFMGLKDRSDTTQKKIQAVRGMIAGAMQAAAIRKQNG